MAHAQKPVFIIRLRGRFYIFFWKMWTFSVLLLAKLCTSAWNYVLAMEKLCSTLVWETASKIPRFPFSSPPTLFCLPSQSRRTPQDLKGKPFQHTTKRYLYP